MTYHVNIRFDVFANRWRAHVYQDNKVVHTTAETALKETAVDLANQWIAAQDEVSEDDYPLPG